MSGAIFISYASEDEQRAARVAETLRARGSEVWFAPRDVLPTDNFVRRIEDGLDQATTVLVLWSRHAAASRWVRVERDSALARRLNGTPIQVTMARLDDEQVPPLSAAERFLDLRSDTTWQEELAKLLDVGPETDASNLDRRVVETELTRPQEIEAVVTHIQRQEPVVVLVPRKAGGHAFTRQLQAYLKRLYPDWDVVGVPTQALADEQLEAYLERLRALMGIRDTGSRLVVCVHGWSHGPEQYHNALARELRAYLEGGVVQRPFSMVAIGSYSLFLLRYGSGQMSVLNSAMQVDLPDLTLEQIYDLMEQIGSGRWSREDAGEVWRRAGAHPYLTKFLLRAWLRHPEGGWSAAEEALEGDQNYLLPRLAAAVQNPAAKEELRRCLDAPDGIGFSLLNPRSPRLYLYYEGLLRRQGRRLTFRCGVVQRLIEEFFAEAS